jgi:tRNA 2-thiouridine synthesizing protein A
VVLPLFFQPTIPKTNAPTLPIPFAEQCPMADPILDTTGLNCPLPVLKARKRLMAMAPGERLVLIATDPAAKRDVPAFCEATGHVLLELVEEASGRLVFQLGRKP